MDGVFRRAADQAADDVEVVDERVGQLDEGFTLDGSESTVPPPAVTVRATEKNFCPSGSSSQAMFSTTPTIGMPTFWFIDTDL